MPDGEVLKTYTDRYLVVYHSVDNRSEQSKRDDFDKFHEGDPAILKSGRYSTSMVTPSLRASELTSVRARRCAPGIRSVGEGKDFSIGLGVFTVSIASDVRMAFADYRIGRPCTGEEIARAQKQLGHPLPPLVRELYEEINGFLGPTDAPFFFPLLDEPGNSARQSLVGYTLFLRSEDYFPSFLANAVAVGDDGTGPMWLVFLDQPQRVALWDPEWGDGVEWLEGGLFDVWLKAKATYDAIRKRRLTER